MSDECDHTCPDRGDHYLTEVLIFSLFSRLFYVTMPDDPTMGRLTLGLSAVAAVGALFQFVSWAGKKAGESLRGREGRWRN